MAANEPMTAGVAGRYASALFDLAKEQGRLDEVEGDLKKMEWLLVESAELRRLIQSPVFSFDDQSRALNTVMVRAGLAELASKFFLLIARNRRLFAAPDMIRVFKSLAAQSRGETTAEVASAFALNAEQLGALKDALRKSVGKDVQLETKVDPSLIGGLVVKVGSRMIDGSLRTRFAMPEASLKGAG